eukprot:gene5951-6641_t
MDVTFYTALVLLITAEHSFTKPLKSAQAITYTKIKLVAKNIIRKGFMKRPVVVIKRQMVQKDNEATEQSLVVNKAPVTTVEKIQTTVGTKAQPLATTKPPNVKIPTPANVIPVQTVMTPAFMASPVPTPQQVQSVTGPVPSPKPPATPATKTSLPIKTVPKPGGPSNIPTPQPMQKLLPNLPVYNVTDNKNNTGPVENVENPQPIQTVPKQAKIQPAIPAEPVKPRPVITIKTSPQPAVTSNIPKTVQPKHKLLPILPVYNVTDNNQKPVKPVIPDPVEPKPVFTQPTVTTHQHVVSPKATVQPPSQTISQTFQWVVVPKRKAMTPAPLLNPLRVLPPHKVTNPKEPIPPKEPKQPFIWFPKPPAFPPCGCSSCGC